MIIIIHQRYANHVGGTNIESSRETFGKARQSQTLRGEGHASRLMTAASEVREVSHIDEQTFGGQHWLRSCFRDSTRRLPIKFMVSHYQRPSSAANSPRAPFCASVKQPQRN
ncbi:uncharacterized protein LAESUDRAFT_732920 [Laetiporus sulphureus 93-53]|uniref:Uncharacterized protein n=1 Tax=Laetiporus sulphureus 93-53 TaxID=1314785 RepID=A0A165AVF9_9APHY|nr:uncharacterized protein LAESUDRAFT_732920 [Laetiporus sulphureus 93-53]KZS99740.1 hypothetical protein LAESUDRAFT_732920 [Laetiporus sulphureus 93-53]